MRKHVGERLPLYVEAENPDKLVLLYGTGNNVRLKMYH